MSFARGLLELSAAIGEAPEDSRRRYLLPCGRSARLRRRRSRFRPHANRSSRAAAAQRYPSRGRRRDQLDQRRDGGDHHGRIRSGLLGASRQYRPHVGGLGEHDGQELGPGAVTRLVRCEALDLCRCRRQRRDARAGAKRWLCSLATTSTIRASSRFRHHRRLHRHPSDEASPAAARDRRAAPPAWLRWPPHRRSKPAARHARRSANCSPIVVRSS